MDDPRAIHYKDEYYPTAFVLIHINPSTSFLPPSYSRMNPDRDFLSQSFSIDVSANLSNDALPNSVSIQSELLSHLVKLQQQQNELLKELVHATTGVQKQRTAEIQKWRESYPTVAKNCRHAAEILSRIQVEFLDCLTKELLENEEALLDGGFMLQEFVDRFGPRLSHLSGIMQVVSLLSEPLT